MLRNLYEGGYILEEAELIEKLATFGNVKYKARNRPLKKLKIKAKKRIKI